MSPSTPEPTTWARVRAALIALAIAVGLVAGIPLPPDELLGQVPRWYARLVPSIRKTQDVLLWPFRPIGDTFVLTQRWNLFSSAKTRRHWLALEGRLANGEWVLLYRPHDPDHDHAAAPLEYRRVRGAWNPRGLAPQSGYAAFVAYEAQVTCAVRYELTAVRARMEVIEILPKGRGFRQTGHYEFELVHECSGGAP